MSVNPDMIHTEQCASAFRRMFWAFLFFLDLRIVFCLMMGLMKGTENMCRERPSA